MEIEKEVRYQINKDTIEKILEETKEYIPRDEMLDITCGYNGFDSYSIYKYICRVRKKGNHCSLEVKNYSNEQECVEQSITLNDARDGINYLKLIGMKPYLYLKRYREVRKYKDLKIFIDEFDILGDFVEIEYQDSKDSKKTVEEFLNIIKIKEEPKEMYGDIVKKKLREDVEFKELFENNLEEILKGKYIN